MLLKKSEALYLNLDELEGVKSLLYELDHEGFPNLKYLHAKSGSNIEYIIHSKQWIISEAFPVLRSLYLQNLTNLKKICHGQLPPESFSRLKNMKVGSCEKLNNLFSFSVAKVFLQLEEIEVNDCENVTEIISEEKAIDDNEAMDALVFRQLQSLRPLQSLPQLICFCSREVHPKTSSTRSTSDKNYMYAEFVPWQGIAVILDDKEATNKSVSSLSRSLRLQSLSKLCFCWREVSYTETTSTSSRDMTLLNQKELYICMHILFPSKGFTSFHCIQNLTSLVIKDCNSQHLFPVSVATTLMQLKFLEINDCEMMRAILITEETGQVIYKVSFSQLNSLKLINLPRLKGFCSGNSILIEFPSLKRLEIDQCSELKEFVFKSISIDRKPEDTDSDSSLKNPLLNEKVLWNLFIYFCIFLYTCITFLGTC
ncbi:uncharacterized protein LOC110416019 [Herrania umbratica]|uniref:Uncharacterized protein LOC110416019 n=1 Tax=Herrania umbratica TaxID=108875 RepID=A0A6J1A9S7_9ROSI|nr:uncharacterized protein LOC110416019 [Herrania umbratica]